MPKITAEQSRRYGRLGGRPKYAKTIAVEKLREFIVNKVAKEADNLLSAQLDLAKGVVIGSKEINKKTGKKEIVNIYSKEPDNKAIEYLFNQSIGKAKESLEISGGIKITLDVM